MPFEDDLLGELVEPPPKITKVSGEFDTTQSVELNTNWKKFLASLTVADVLKEKKAAGKTPLVTVDSDITVADTLHKLAENDILSAPVMDRSGKCLGFVDVLDLEGLAFKIMKNSNLQLHEFFSNPFFEKKVKDALPGSAADDWVPVQGTTSLLEVLCAFTGQSMFRPHRLPVMDKEGTITGIISQSDILKVAAQNKHLLGNCLHKTIEDLKIERAVIAARSNVPASDVLGLLTDNRVHGIAVVEHPTSKLIANLSASDLRGMTRNDLALFDKPVIVFLEAIYAKRGLTVEPPISCRPKAVFEQVISLLDDNNIHRVFVTDGEQRAIGVISIGDVVEALKNC